jgi:hypothetical protein
MLRLPRLFPLSLAALVVGCTGPVGQSELEIKTGGGHVLDDRAWAVGSDISISAQGTALGATSVAFESEGDRVIVENDDNFYGGLSLPSLFPGMDEYRFSYGTVAREGDFDIVVDDGWGNETLRLAATTREVDDVALGVALDDCPEFADFVFDPDSSPAVLEGSTVTLTPAPLDDEGNPLVGTVDVTWDTDLDNRADAWGLDDWGSLLTVDITESGFVSLAVGDTVREFEILAVSEDDLSDIHILAMPEKHGEESASLLSVVGTTADGQLVHGLTPEWSTGASGQTVHAENSAPIEACFGGLCTTWDGIE